MSLQRSIIPLALVLYLGSYLAGTANAWSPLLALRTILALFLMYLAGFSLTRLTTRLFKIPQDPYLQFTLSLLNAIFFIPPMLLAINYFWGGFSITSIFILYAALILPGTLFPNSSSGHSHRPVSSVIYQVSVHPLFWACLIVFVVHLLTVTAFYHLPGPDSYTILEQFQQEFSQLRITAKGGYERISFKSLIASIHFLSAVPLYALFKYLFPFIAVLSVFPLWLVARELDSFPARLAILLFPLASPTLILEYDITRHQNIFLFGLFSFVSLLFSSHRLSKPSLFYLTGIYLFFGLFYHPLFSICFLAWLFSSLLRLRNYHIKVKYLLPLLILFIIFTRFGVLDMVIRISENIRLIISRIGGSQTNFSFPAHYINTDGNNVGWPGWLGVAKYYAFYAGPLLLLLLSLLAMVVLLHPPTRSTLKRLHFSLLTLPITLLLLLFFAISDILPRLVNLAYLPDRAWQYLAALSTLPAFSLLSARFRTKLSTALPLFLLGTIALSVSGALYVNYLNSFTIPNYEYKAAAWIKENLPPDRTFIGASSSKLLTYHAESKMMKIPIGNIISDNSETMIATLKEKYIISFHNPYLGEVSQLAITGSGNIKSVLTLLNWVESQRYVPQGSLKGHLDQFQQLSDQYDKISSSLTGTLQALDQEGSRQSLKSDAEQKSLYVYYAATHPRNPYLKRPYLDQRYSQENVLVFPSLDYPDSPFTRVYQDGNDVIIWKVSLELLFN